MNRPSKKNLRRSQSADNKKKSTIVPQQSDQGNGQQQPAGDTDRSTEAFAKPQDSMRNDSSAQTITDSNGRVTTPSGDGHSSLKRRSSLRRSLRRLSGSSAPTTSVASRLSIEVVPGSFHKVAGISAEEELASSDTVDGQFHRGAIRTVEIKLGADRSVRGFDVEQQYRPNSVAHNGLAFVIAGVRGDSIVSAQRLLRDGDEVIAVNGLPLDTVRRVQDVEQLLRASENLRLRVRCVSDGDDARYTPRRSLTPAATPQHAPSLSSSGNRSPPFQAHEDSVEFSRPDRSSASAALRSEEVDGKAQRKLSPSSGNGDIVANGEVRQSPDPGESTPTERDEENPVKPPPPTEYAAQRQQASRPRPLPPERKSRQAVKRRDSLRSARKLVGGPEEQPVAPTVMLEMAHVFVDEKEKIAPEQRRQLLAECLAEEFNLPFLVEQASALTFGD